MINRSKKIKTTGKIRLFYQLIYSIFAAAVPICGSVNPDRLPAAKEVKFRIFHGDADDVVTVEGSREAYKALKAAGAKVEYIEFPGCNHGSWNPAFNYPGFMEWLFKQKK